MQNRFASPSIFWIRPALVIAALLVHLVWPRLSHGQVPASCVAPKWQTSGGGRIVDVWLASGATYGVAARLGFNPTLTERALQQAISIWNEQSGARFLLRYRGTQASNGGCVQDAINIVAGDLLCDGLNGTIAQAHPYDNNGDDIVECGVVWLRKFFNDNSDQCTTPIPWQFATENVYPDVTSVLVHEIGHTFGFHHSDIEECAPLGRTDELSVMRGGGISFGRVLREWDKHRLMNAYGNRAATAVATRRDWNGSAWVTGTPLAIPMLHRPGASQNYAWTSLSWFRRQPTNRQVVSAKFIQNDNALTSVFAFSPNQSSHQQVPGAVAIQPSTGRAIAVYQRRLSTRYANMSDRNTICYRLSTDSGVSFGSEYCSANFTWRYGVTVAYDPYSQRFIYAYASPDGSGNALQEDRIRLVTMNTDGTSIVGSLLSAKASSAPSLACRNAASGCRFAYHSTSDSLLWTEFGVTAAGAVAIGTTYQHPFYTDESPSIVWFEHDQTYRLALRQGIGGIFSYSMSATGSTWVGTGDIWNTTTAGYSAPVLSTERSCFFGHCTGALRAWAVRWW